MSLRDNIEIEDTINAIEEAKQQLAEAEYVVKFYPVIINELEKKLFGLIRTNEMNYSINQSQETVKFHKKYFKCICDGSKTQTMRLARKRWDVQEGDIVTAVFPGLDETLDIRINMIGYKQFKSLIMEDALLEGFETIAELKNELTRIYPTINRWDRLYYYRFEVVK